VAERRVAPLGVVITVSNCDVLRFADL